MPEFKGFPKIPRLSRECVITEKIDGTNAAVLVTTEPVHDSGMVLFHKDGLSVYAQKRNGFVFPGHHDNFGFAAWVRDHGEELLGLGVGLHFGEWWGSGIQRGYGLTNGEKRFSLFNTSVWSDPAVRPGCCGVVPVLYQGTFDTKTVDLALDTLSVEGSRASPGFLKPEGVVVWHVAAGVYFKKTIEKDEQPKG